MTTVDMSSPYMYLRQYDGEDIFEVAVIPITVYWGDYRIHVHVGFKTDLASKPPPLNTSGKWNKAAVVHDFLYNGGEMYHMTLKVMLAPTREQADQIFCDIMEELGVDDIEREIMHGAVALFGDSSWKGKD